MTRYHSTLCGCIYDVDADYNWIDQQVEIEGVITSHICDKHLPENNGRKDRRILELLKQNRERLAALKAVFKVFDCDYGHGISNGYWGNYKDIHEQALQAIAKAEGER